ncbi:hypothetical protein [Hymenobacter cellulosilyticus]|uniref:Uncharacterized protein n=1 Tax=Hymenobacter cellulosilyticus TaxID=2932248 RepID=A0A8T9PZS2_9BACT|nr:hypothetical protein [Hymenobacter cellulosilyticus]UOQ70986.1 hypothetical protein MUN79_20260 [Hymenobacter cellulosilyticus]
MSILERRLAEIQAKQNPADAAATPPAQAAAAPTEPVPAATAPVASTTTNEITERPAQGTPPVTDTPGLARLSPLRPLPKPPPIRPLRCGLEKLPSP